MTLRYKKDRKASSRIRDWGYSPGRYPTGRKNSVLDVPGVKVGQLDLHQGTDIHTGVTVIFPRGFKDTYYIPSYAAFHEGGFNEAGEWTGAHQVREWGFLKAPVAFTNTVSVGKVYDSLFRYGFKTLAEDGIDDLEAIGYMTIPAVGETLDSVLNDVKRSAIEDEHVLQAIENAKTQIEVLEGNHGGGVAMRSHGYKGGTGTSSRVLKGEDGKEYVVGVIVQNNYGSAVDLHIDGVPIGKLLMKKKKAEKETASASAATNTSPPDPPLTGKAAEGSCLVLIITSAPLLPHQLRRLAQRATLGLGAISLHGAGRHYSGEIFMAISTGTNHPEKPAKYFDHAHQSMPDILETDTVESVKSELMDALFAAAAEATEEACLNAMTCAETLEGYRGFVAEELPRKEVEEWLREYGRSRIPV